MVWGFSQNQSISRTNTKTETLHISKNNKIIMTKERMGSEEDRTKVQKRTIILVLYEQGKGLPLGRGQFFIHVIAIIHG